MTEDQPSAPSSTSLTLLAELQSGKADAWQRFVRLYGPLVYGWCRQTGAQPSDAEDVAQEVFRAVFAHVDRFRMRRPGDSFRGWLWTITRNKLRNFFRARMSGPVAAGGTDAYGQLVSVPEALDPSSSEVLDAEIRLTHRALRLIQTEFEPRTWQAFWRTAVDGCSGAEVCSELGMTPGAVRQAKYRVLHRLRQVLEQT